MENSRRRIQEIKENGYELDFSNAFNPAFEIYKKIAGSAGAVMLLIVIVLLIMVFIGIFAFMGLDSIGENMRNFSPVNLSLPFLLLYCVLVFAGSIFSILLTAGLLQMAYNAFHNLDFSMGTVLEHFKSGATKELVIGGIIIAVPNLIQILLFEYITLSFIGSIISMLIGLFTFLMVPLIIFGKLKASDAVMGSIHVLLKNFLMIFLLLIVSYILALVGMIACGIGVVFTIPFMYAMITSIYLNIFESPALNLNREPNPL